jgi:hypothetical protein
LDATKERKKIWRKRKQWLIGAGVMIIAAIIAIVLGVVLGTNNDVENDVNTESTTFILLKDMVTSMWPDSSKVLSDESSPQYLALKWLEGNAYLDDYPEWNVFSATY